MKEQEKQLVEMASEQAAEGERLAGELEKQSKHDEQELERKLQEEMDKLLTEKKNKQEAELRARTDISDEKLQQVMKRPGVFDWRPR